MKIINNHEYSKKSFGNYKRRVKIEIIDTEDKEYSFDVYTTRTYLEKIRSDLMTIATDKVKIINIIHSATRDEDDLATEMINEWLNE